MNNVRIYNRSSKLFQPFTAIQKNVKSSNTEITSKSQKLMLDNGIIKQSSPGCYHLLPLGVRSLNKLIKLIDTEMKNIDAQKVMFPTLTNAKLWKTSGRYEDVSNELFKLKDRHDSEYLLSPTHEEAAADLIASFGTMSYKKYPLKLYQITSKFRDEMKPRFGLMRSRQFIMKDLYTFDVNMENAKTTYDDICASYDQLFRKIAVDWVKVLGASGTMGGNLSHEYHFLSELGEDKLLHCNNCNLAANFEYLKQTELQLLENDKKCPKCSSNNVKITNGIEVGHTFLLGEKYSKPLQSKCLKEDGKSQVVQMGSYGLGVSRILAASIEVLSEDMAIRWPDELTPFRVVIMGPKNGSKEESSISVTPEQIYGHLNEIPHLNDDILYDDRADLTIGKRLLEAKRTGYPFMIVIGSKATQSPPIFEVIDMCKQEQLFLSLEQVVDFFKNNHRKAILSEKMYQKNLF